MPDGIPRDSVQVIQVKCPVCHHKAESYPTGGTYAILDCSPCNGFFKITDRAEAVLSFPFHWNAVSGELHKILRGIERGRYWEHNNIDSKMPVLYALEGLSVKFEGRTWSVPLPK